MQLLTERQKRYIRQLKGIKKPFSLDNPTPSIKKVRDFNGPMVSTFVPSKPRGKSGCRMSHEKRALLFQRAMDREAFFAALES